MKNLFRLCVLFVAVSCFGSAELSAQSKSKTKSKTTASKKTSSKKTSSGRLPRYFTHLKLDEAQRDEVLQIQADYKKQLADQRKNGGVERRTTGCTRGCPDPNPKNALQQICSGNPDSRKQTADQYKFQKGNERNGEIETKQKIEE